MLNLSLTNLKDIAPLQCCVQYFFVKLQNESVYKPLFESNHSAAFHKTELDPTGSV